MSNTIHHSIGTDMFVLISNIITEQAPRLNPSIQDMILLPIETQISNQIEYPIWLNIQQ